jgi:hypothetical protein
VYPDSLDIPVSIQPRFAAFVSTRHLARVLVAAAACGASALPGYSLVFNFTPAAGTPAAAISALQIAGERWSSQLGDNVTINLNFAFTTLAPNVRAATSSAMGTISYAGFRTALSQDRTSALDNTAVANLPLSSVALLINRTSDNLNGSGSAVPMLDNNASANNTTIRTTSANAKALGLLAANNPAVDGSISVNSTLTWDFDLSDGLAPGFRDFIGTATHELGHVLGFTSGVDFLDTNSPPVGGPVASNTLTRVTPLDLFRFSTLSVASNAIDWTADSRTKFFSVDGGLTMGPAFSTGSNFGDGAQASHWKDNLGIGIMDPTASISEIRTISQNDLVAMDAIGWNRVADTGSTVLQFGMAFAVLGWIRARRSLHPSLR